MAAGMIFPGTAFRSEVANAWQTLGGPRGRPESHFEIVNFERRGYKRPEWTGIKPRGREERKKIGFIAPQCVQFLGIEKIFAIPTYHICFIG